MTTRDDQKQRTYESILASAIRLLRERGIGGASVADVMRGAGLTVGGFYAHFATKEALVDEAPRRGAAEVRPLLFSRLNSKPAEARAEVRSRGPSSAPRSCRAGRSAARSFNTNGHGVQKDASHDAPCIRR